MQYQIYNISKIRLSATYYKTKTMPNFKNICQCGNIVEKFRNHERRYIKTYCERCHRSIVLANEENDAEPGGIFEEVQKLYRDNYG